MTSCRWRTTVLRRSAPCSGMCADAGPAGATSTRRPRSPFPPPTRPVSVPPSCGGRLHLDPRLEKNHAQYLERHGAGSLGGAAVGPRRWTRSTVPRAAPATPRTRLLTPQHARAGAPGRSVRSSTTPPASPSAPPARRPSAPQNGVNRVGGRRGRFGARPAGIPAQTIPHDEGGTDHGSYRQGHRQGQGVRRQGSPATRSARPRARPSRPRARPRTPSSTPRTPPATRGSARGRAAQPAERTPAPRSRRLPSTDLRSGAVAPLRTSRPSRCGLRFAQRGDRLRERCAAALTDTPCRGAER